MKKKILSGVSVFAVLLLLMTFALIYNQGKDEDLSPATPSESYDALLLIDSQKYTSATRYDLTLFAKDNSENSSYYPVTSEENGTFYYQKDLNPLITRNLTLPQDNSDFCQYGLFQKDGKSFAVFYSSMSEPSNAERLCQLLLCYRDYFPILLLGTFDQDSASLISDVCQMSLSQQLNQTTLTSNLSVFPHEESGTLLLTFEKTPRTLDLSKKNDSLNL